MKMKHGVLHTERGFTLIELVIVIVIVGILAAVALPKFLSLSADARAGAIRGVAGSMASANVGIYSAAQVQNQGGATGAVNVCGQTSLSTVYGYAADMTALNNCLSLSTDFVVGANSVNYSGYTNCKVTYAAATSSAAPTYTLSVSNTDCSS